MLQFIAAIVLGRFISSEEYSKIIIPLFLFGLMNVIGDLGIGSFILRNRAKEIGITRTLNLINLFSFVFFLTALCISLALDQEILVSIIFIAAGLISVRMQYKINFIRIRGDMDKLSKALFFSSIVSFFVVGLPAVYFFESAFSLGLYTLSGMFISNVLVRSQFGKLVKTNAEIFKIRMFVDTMRTFDRKDLAFLGSSLTIWGIYNIDNFLAARLLDNNQSGIYLRGFQILIAPHVVLAQTLQFAIFPKIKKSSMNSGINEVFGYCARIIALYVVLYVIYEVILYYLMIKQDIIFNIIGYQWREIAQLFWPFAIIPPLILMSHIMSSFFTVNDISYIEMFINTASILLIILLSMLFVRSVTDLGLIVSAVFSIRIILCSIACFYLLRGK